MSDKPKLIFVNPPYEEYGAGKGRRGQIRVYPSLGIAYLISSLETDPDIDCDIKLIDCCADDLDVEGLLARLVAEQPAMVLITVGTFTIRVTKQITDACRKALPAARIVLGGIHFNHSPREFKHFDADYALRGDCEFTIRTLIKCMLKNDEDGIRNIEGIIYKDGGDVVFKKPAGIKDLDSIPFPDRTRLDPGKYIYPLFDKKFTTIIGSRGCPYKCVYCGLPNNLSYRRRSVENIIEELKTIVARGYEYVSFSDDLFSLDRKRVLELCAQIQANKLCFEWGCATRADCVDYELLSTMKAAGCRDVRFGIETGVEKLRGTSGNSQTVVGRLCESAISGRIVPLRRSGLHQKTSYRRRPEKRDHPQEHQQRTIRHQRPRCEESRAGCRGLLHFRASFRNAGGHAANKPVRQQPRTGLHRHQHRHPHPGLGPVQGCLGRRHSGREHLGRRPLRQKRNPALPPPRRFPRRHESTALRIHALLLSTAFVRAETAQERQKAFRTSSSGSKPVGVSCRITPAAEEETVLLVQLLDAAALLQRQRT